MHLIPASDLRNCAFPLILLLVLTIESSALLGPSTLPVILSRGVLTSLKLADILCIAVQVLLRLPELSLDHILATLQYVDLLVSLSLLLFRVLKLLSLLLNSLRVSLGRKLDLLQLLLSLVFLAVGMIQIGFGALKVQFKFLDLLFKLFAL